jgi:hypothetical protein
MLSFPPSCHNRKEEGGWEEDSDRSELRKCKPESKETTNPYLANFISSTRTFSCHLLILLFFYDSGKH